MRIIYNPCFGNLSRTTTFYPEGMVAGPKGTSEMSLEYSGASLDPPYIAMNFVLYLLDVN